MGWNSSSDTKSQIKVFFDSLKNKLLNGLNITIDINIYVEEPKVRKVKIKSYASNFDINRKEPWTH